VICLETKLGKELEVNGTVFPDVKSALQHLAGHANLRVVAGAEGQLARIEEAMARLREDVRDLREKQEAVEGMQMTLDKLTLDVAQIPAFGRVLEWMRPMVDKWYLFSPGDFVQPSEIKKLVTEAMGGLGGSLSPPGATALNARTSASLPSMFGEVPANFEQPEPPKESRLNMIEAQLTLMEDRVGSRGVRVGSEYWASPSDLKVWMTQYMPKYHFGYFVEAVTYMDSFVMGHCEADEIWSSGYNSQKCGWTNAYDARSAASSKTFCIMCWEGTATRATRTSISRA